MGRTSVSGRELLPPLYRLQCARNTDTFLRWSDTETIPPSEMLSYLDRHEVLWMRLTTLLQETWKSLTNSFESLRIQDDFIRNASLVGHLPVVVDFPNGCEALSLTSPAASGTTLVQAALF
jgi:hypothetical protein